MPEISAIKTALYTWVSEACGITAIFSNQSKPRPATPYATIHVISGMVPVGMYDQSETPDTGAGSASSTISGLRTFTASINIFGAGATEYIRLLQNSIQKRDFVDFGFRKKQISKIEIASVVYSTAYTLNIDGEPVTYTSGVGAIEADIVAGINTAINTNQYLQDGVESSVVTGNVEASAYYGLEFEIEADDVSLLTVTETQKAVDVVPLSCQGSIDLTGLMETRWEERAQCDFFFLTNSKFVEEIGVIESVEIDNLINGETIDIP